MKTASVLATALLSMGLVCALQAQGPPPGGGRPGGPGMGGGRRNFDPAQREWDILKQLNLSKAQDKHMHAVTDEYSKSVKSAFASMMGGAGRPGGPGGPGGMRPGGAGGPGGPGGRGGGGGFGGMREKVKPIRDAYEKKLKGVLTPAQMAKYTKLRDEERAKMRAMFGGGRGGPGGGRPGGPGR